MVTEGEQARLWAQIMDRLNLTVAPRPSTQPGDAVCLEVHCADHGPQFATTNPKVPSWKPIRIRPESLRTVHLPVHEV